MNSKNTNKVKSILEMSNRAVLRKVDEAYSQVMENIHDVNTDPLKKRKIVITMTIAADSERKNPVIESEVVAKLVSPHSIRMNLFDTVIEDSETGEVVHAQAEASYAVPGQINLDGEVNLPNVYIPENPDGKAN